MVLTVGVVAGAMILGLGHRASSAALDRVSTMLTGSFPAAATWFVVGAAAAFGGVVMLLILRRRARGASLRLASRL